MRRGGACIPIPVSPYGLLSPLDLRGNVDSSLIQSSAAVIASRLSHDLCMSALGQKQTPQKVVSALSPIATAIADSRKRSCLLYPSKRTCAVHQPMSLWAKSGH